MRGPPFVGKLFVAVGICMLVLSIGVGVDQAIGCTTCDVTDCNAASPATGCAAICNTPPNVISCVAGCKCGEGSGGGYCTCSYTF
jgi:hypothetical protein